MTMRSPRRPFSPASFRLALVALALAAVAAWAAPSASGQGDWYWTPGACKSVLQSGGVELADGRTFNVASSFCIGLGGADTCQWSSNRRVRLYSAFVVFTRSYDGAVRTFTLHPVARDDFRASQPRLLGVEPDAVEFREFIAPVATSVARRQHSAGCAPYRG